MSRLIWTRSKVRAEAQKHKTRGEFIKSAPSAYNAARRYGILDDVCAHMRYVNKTQRWTMDQIKFAARPYATRTEFQHGNPAAYSAANRRGVLHKVLPETHLLAAITYHCDVANHTRLAA